jgi:tetratricopeptide (TPR) repeat protein
VIADDPTAAFERMAVASREAVAMAERLGQPELLSLALDVGYITDQFRDDVPALVAGVERRVQLADQIHAGIDLDDIFYMAAQAYWEQGRYRDALAATDEGVARVSAVGAEAVGSECTGAVTRMLLGDWDALVSHYRTIAARWTEPPGFLRMLYAAAEFVLAARGDHDAAEHIRRMPYRTVGRLGYRALGLLAEGRTDEALAYIRQPAQADGVCFALLAEAEVLRAAQRWDELAAHVRRIRERSARTGWVIGPAAADRAEAAIAAARGAFAAAEPLLRRSVAGFSDAGAEWEAARSALDLADALHALEQGDEVSATLDRAAPAIERAGSLLEIRRLADLRHG